MDFNSFLNSHKPEELKNYIFCRREGKIYLEEKGVFNSIKRTLFSKEKEYDLLSIVEDIRKDKPDLDQNWKIVIDNEVFHYADKNQLEIPKPLNTSIIKTAEIFSKNLTKSKSILSQPSLLDGKWEKLGFTPKTYAFTNGDTFMKDTGLEGGDVRENIDLILSHFGNREFNNKDEIVSLLDQISIYTPSTFSYDEENVEQYANHLSEQIKGLLPGQKMLINGGWTTHAMLYLVEKTQDGKFALSVVNTGAGINDFHQSEDLGAKVKYKPLVRIHQIEEAAITNTELWKSFTELETKGKVDGTLWEHSANDIYGRILPSLQGKRDLDFENDIEFITDQRSGTCSWKAVMKLIFLISGDTRTYKQENFLFRYLSNVEFNDDILNSDDPSDDDVQLLKRGSESFVRYALKLHEDGMINDKDLEEVLALKKRIDSTIQQQEQKLERSPPPLDPEQKISIEGSVRESFFQTHQPLAGVLTESERVPKDLQIPKLDPFPQTFTDLQQRVNDFYQASMELTSSGCHRLFIQELSQFLSSSEGLLLQPGVIENLCMNQNAAEVEKLMESIFGLNESLFFSISQLSKEERLSPDHLALMTVLGGINTMLMRQMPEEHCPAAIRNALQPVPTMFYDYLMMKDPFAIIQDKKLELLFYQAREYFQNNPVANLNEFEGWFYIDESNYFQVFENDKIEGQSLMLDLLKHAQVNNPQLKGLNDRQLIQKAMATFGKKNCPLPKFFQLLLKQFLFCRYIKHDPDFLNADWNSLDISFRQTYSKGGMDRYQIDFYGQKNAFKNQTRYQLDYNYGNKLSAQTHFKREGLKNILKDWKGIPPDMGQLLEGNGDSNRAVLMKAEKGLTREETQSLRYFCSNNLTLIPNLISYFNEHFEKLLEQDYQLFLYHALFSGEHLIDMIKNSPKVIEKLNEFLVHQYQLHKGLGDIQSQLFFLRLINDLGDLTKTPGTDVKKELETLAASVKDGNLEGKRTKALVYNQLIASYHNREELSEAEIIKLSKAYIYVQTFGFDHQLSDPVIIHNMYRTMDRVHAGLNQLSQNNRQQIASEALKETLSIEGGSEYSVDLNAFTILHGTNPIGGLPYQIFNDVNFLELFGKHSFTTTISAPGVYEFTFKPSAKAPVGSFRVFFSETTNKVQIQKNIEGSWYTYVPNHQLEEMFDSVALNTGYFHWVGESDNPQMIIEKKEDHLVHSKIVFEENNWYGGSEFSIKQWQKYDHKKGEYGAGLNQFSPEQADFLDQFQPKQTIFLWDDSVEFSSLGIEFHKKDDKYLYSKDAKYHLADQQTPPVSLKYFSGYLKIANDKGRIKYLIPKAPLQQNISGALQRNISINTDSVVGNEFMTFKEKNGKLIAKTAEEFLFLAYLHLAHKNYADAFEALQQYNAGKPQGYGADEKRMIDWIYNFIKIGGDKSPEGIALALQAISVYIRNLQPEERNEAKKKIGTTVSSLLREYYPSAQNTRKYLLKPSQEKELLEFSGLTSESLRQRNQQIASFSAEIKPEIELDQVVPKAIEIALQEAKNKKIEDIYLNGGKRLASRFDNILDRIASEDPEIRLKATSELILMKIPEDDIALRSLHSMLLLIAKHSTPEIRLHLSQSSSNYRLGTIEGVIAACKEINELKIKHEPTPELFSINITKPVPQVQKEDPSEAAKAGFKQSADYKPPVYSCEKVFTNFKIKLEKAEPQKIENDDLMNAFAVSKKNASRVAQKEIDTVINSIRAYTDKVNTGEKFAITDEQLDTIHEVFDLVKNGILERADSQKSQIERLLNKEPGDYRENLIYKLQVHGQVKKALTIDDLIILYLQNNTQELLKQNPHLTKEDIAELTNLVTDYLVNMTECDYLDNFVKTAGKALKATGEGKQKFLDDINALIKSNRSYDVKADRIMLIFEFYSGFRLRDDQIAIIRKMTITDPSNIKNYIVQLIMGSGKSKVILPLLALLNSRGDNIPIIIVPDELYEINLEDMKFVSGQFAHQEVETILMKEGEQIGEKDIDEILKKFARVKEHRSYLLVNPAAVHSLRLYADSIYHALSESEVPSEELCGKYAKIKQVMNMLKTQGDAIIDEPDIVLNCRKETNVACGGWENIAGETQDIIEEIFTSLIAKPELSRYMKIEKETEASLDEADYQENVKPQLVQIFIDMALKEGMIIEEKDKKAIEDYLLSSKELEKKPSVIADAPYKVQATLAVGKEMIKTLFPLLITNHCDNNFGLSKKTGSNLALPYAGSNKPSEGSLFGTPYESLIYTMAYYTRKGVSVKQIQSIIGHLKSEALRESKARKIPLEETKAFKQFQDLNLFPTKHLFNVQDSEIADALSQFNANVDNRMRFARQFGWIELQVNKAKYSSNAQDLVGTFRSGLGFSGTFPNIDPFHRSLIPVPDPIITGKTLSLMSHAGSQVLPFANLEAFIKSLANYTACIDIGSWFRGIDAIDVAKKIFEVLPDEMKGIVYVNDVDIPPGTKDQQVILERGEEIPILLSRSKLSPEERFTYYNIITGVDIDQPDFAMAIATIGETTTLRDFEQGTWRMRGLENRKQIVDIATPEELAISSKLEDAFIFCTHNQAKVKEKDNPFALQQKIQHENKSVLENVLRDEKTSPQQAGEFVRAAKELVVKPVSQDPVQQLGGVSVREKMDIIANAQIQQALDYVKTSLYDRFDIFEEKTPYATLKSQIEGLPKYEGLPEEDYWQPAQKGQQTDYGVKTQVKTQTKTQTKTHLQVKAIEETDELAHQAKSDVTWHDIRSNNLFSYQYWDSANLASVNQHLQINQEHLYDYDANQPLFADNLQLSENFISFSNDHESIPFQRGNKPEGICSLRIDRETGRMKLDFLHPKEAETLWKMLESEKRTNVDQIEAHFLKVEEAKAKFYADAKKVIADFCKANNVPSYYIDPDEIEDKLKNIDWDDPSKLYYRFPSEFVFPSGSDGYRLREPIEEMWKQQVCAVKAQKMDAYVTFPQAQTMFTQEKDFDLFLVNPGTGIVKAGKEEIDEETLKQNPEYNQLMVQAKFYNGTLDDYTDEEAEYLALWVQEVGVERLESFLLNNIFRTKAEERNRYENSRLKQILNEAVALHG